MELVDKLAETALAVANNSKISWTGFCKLPEHERPLHIVSCFSNCLSCRANCLSGPWIGDVVSVDGVPLPPIQ